MGVYISNTTLSVEDAWGSIHTIFLGWKRSASTCRVKAHGISTGGFLLRALQSVALFSPAIYGVVLNQIMTKKRGTCCTTTIAKTQHLKSRGEVWMAPKNWDSWWFTLLVRPQNTEQKRLCFLKYATGCYITWSQNNWGLYLVVVGMDGKPEDQRAECWYAVQWSHCGRSTC